MAVAASPPTVRTVRIGMLGFGTVGTGAFRMLRDNKQAIEQKIGLPIEVVRIGVKDLGKARIAPAEIFTDDLMSIVDDPSIDVVIELIGGTEPASRLVEQAIRNGKHVVTANKEMMAKFGSRLVQSARDGKLDLHYEAAVGGGIPLIQPLKHQLAGNDVLQMMGILNGTTNYILTAMQNEGREFEDVLSEAQSKGYAEADATNDVDGFDTSYKISILASIAFGKQVPIESVYREGIRRVTRLDMAYAKMLGYRIKLLGIVDALSPEVVRVRVHPTLIKADHQLAHVDGVFNALWLRGDFVGDLMFSGRGAGSDPTASAVVGDLIDVGRNIAIGGQGSAIPYAEGMATEAIDTLVTPYYLRLVVNDRPMVLSVIATVFGGNDVSLAAMEMKSLDGESGEIVFLTHPCQEANFQRALAEIARQDVVKAVANWFRVHDGT